MKKEHKDVLECAREAIVDAICCEDGLDGATGEEVVRWITDILGDYETFIETHTDDRWQEKGGKDERGDEDTGCV